MTYINTFELIFKMDQFEFDEETCTEEQLNLLLESFDEDFDFYEEWSSKCPKE